MTTNEFLQTLSPNAISLLKYYTANYHNKNIDIVDDKRIYMIPNKSSVYEIHIDFSMPIQLVEENFVHELMHCIQIEEGYPSVTHLESEYKDVADLISSIVLDFNVDEQLSKRGYQKSTTKLQENLQELFKRLLFSKENLAMKKEFSKMITIIHSCCTIVKGRIYLQNDQLTKMILNIFEKDFHKIYKMQNIIYDCITINGFNSPQEIYKTFKDIVKKLDLKPYVKIVNHMDSNHIKIDNETQDNS